MPLELSPSGQDQTCFHLTCTQPVFRQEISRQPFSTTSPRKDPGHVLITSPWQRSFCTCVSMATLQPTDCTPLPETSHCKQRKSFLRKCTNKEKGNKENTFRQLKNTSGQVQKMHAMTEMKMHVTFKKFSVGVKRLPSCSNGKVEQKSS